MISRISITTSSLFAGLMFCALSSVNADSLDRVQMVRHSETANHKSTTFRVRFAEVDPVQAAQLRRLVDQSRLRLEQEIQQMIDRGASRQSVDQKIARARQILRETTQKILTARPPTTVVIYGKAVKSDMRQALSALKKGELELGSTVHVYLQNGKLVTGSTAPAKYDMPKKPKAGSEVARTSASRPSASNTKGTRHPEFKSLNDEMIWVLGGGR